MEVEIMQRFMVFLLSCALIVMSGCNQNKVDNESSDTSRLSSESVVIPPNSPSEEPTKIDTKLTIPINIVPENDNSKAYETNKTEIEVVKGTDEDIKAYADWINNLSGVDIKALYGEARPVFEYKLNTMNLKDSQLVFDKLRQITKDLYVLPEFENPYTGGGWQLAIHTKEGISTVLFNGGWLVVDIVSMDKGFKFNLENTNGQKLGTEIFNILSDNMNNDADISPTIIYQGSELEHLYAVDTEKYVMAEITNSSQVREILKGFEGRNGERNNLNGYGYLLFNGDGKQYQYLHDDNTDIALTKNCLAALTISNLHPSWLIHFTPERIVSANGVTDKQKLQKLSEFLKHEIIVSGTGEVISGYINPNATMGDFILKIEFDSGVVYSILGTDFFDGTGNMSVHTSDLDTSVIYKLNNGVAQKITAFLQDFN